MQSFAVLLHNVRSAHNVGSIFRTADAAGVEHVYLTGYTPLPIDRFGRSQKDIAKTALGAEGFVPWTHGVSPTSIVKKLKKEGWRVVGVEQHPRAIDYRAFSPRAATLYIFGNEVRGLSKQIVSMCDDVIEIPMHGSKESLNVSVSVGIVLFQSLKA